SRPAGATTSPSQGDRAARSPTGPRPVNGRSDGDAIVLRGLRVVGTHGVLPEEKRRAQPFEVDLELHVDLAPAAASARLEDTVDYAGVAAAAESVVAGPPSYDLLEALAGAVASAALAS